MLCLCVLYVVVLLVLVNGWINGIVTPAANRYGYREGRTERPERSIEEMKRKTFVKQLMALGLERNKANSFCKKMLAAHGWLRARGFQGDVNLENIFEFLVSGMQNPRNGRAR